MTTANRARSMRRRRSRIEGKKLPWRSFGMASSTSPALVVSSRDRCPLRWFVRVLASLMRAAPMPRSPPASIRAWRTYSTALADLVDVAAGAERVEQLIGVKLFMGHRGDLLCRALLGTRRGSLRWSATWWTRSTYTTSRDANLTEEDSVTIAGLARALVMDCLSLDTPISDLIA